MKVGYFPMLPDDPSCYYRMSGVLNCINHPELQFIDITQDKIYNWSVFHGLSALIIQRPTSEAHVSMIRLAKDMNIRVISDWDDDLFNVPVHRNPTISYEDMKSNLKTCLHLSDETWVTTPALKKLYKPFCRNIHIIPNSWNDIMFKMSGKMSFNKQGRLCSYRGGASHGEDVQQNVNDLVNTFKESPEWEFRFVGAGNYDKPGTTMFDQLDYRTKGFKNHTYTMPNSLIQFFRSYNEFNSQVAFFPLVTNEFNKSKSNISLLEGTYAGSCFMGNKELPEFDMPFVIDISKGMYEPFMEIKNDFAKMKRLNFMAFEWMVEERRLSKINILRVERLLSF